MSRAAATESYLHCWFTLNIGRRPELDPICGSAVDIAWFANEVFAGSGMQRMDLLCILKANRGREFRILELKTAPAPASILRRQLRQYIRWIKAYVGEPSEVIRPILVSTPLVTGAPLEEYRELNNDLQQELHIAPLQVWHLDILDSTVIPQQLL